MRWAKVWKRGCNTCNEFQADDIDAVLLIDASNAFNALNRTAPLHNIRVLCPIIAAYTTYKHLQTPSTAVYCWRQRDYVAEGTTQGDR